MERKLLGRSESIEQYNNREIVKTLTVIDKDSDKKENSYEKNKGLKRKMIY